VRIERIINKPIESNCFIVSQKGSCIVMDPGSEDSSIIEKFINGRTVDYIFLTHEHFDHIWCADKIREKYNAKLCCSIETAKAIVDRKRNMSIFYDQVGFELRCIDITLEDRQKIEWHKMPIEIIQTPGHTAGSICIKIDNNIFTGDTIIKNHRTVTKLPTGNKKDLKKSIDCIFCLNKIKVCPGHGEIFMLNNIRKEDLL